MIGPKCFERFLDPTKITQSFTFYCNIYLYLAISLISLPVIAVFGSKTPSEKNETYLCYTEIHQNKIETNIGVITLIDWYSNHLS